DFRIELRIELCDRIHARVEDPILAYRFHIAPLLEQYLDRVLHEPEIEAAPDSLAAQGFAAEKLRAGDVDDVDAARRDQQPLLPGIVAIDGVKRRLDVLDGAEEDRAVDAKHLELRTIGQIGVGVEAKIAVAAKQRLHVANSGARRLIQKQQQRQQHAGV